MFPQPHGYAMPPPQAPYAAYPASGPASPPGPYGPPPHMYASVDTSSLLLQLIPLFYTGCHRWDSRHSTIPLNMVLLVQQGYLTRPRWGYLFPLLQFVTQPPHRHLEGFPSHPLRRSYHPQGQPPLLHPPQNSYPHNHIHRTLCRNLTRSIMILCPQQPIPNYPALSQRHSHKAPHSNSTEDTPAMAPTNPLLPLALGMVVAVEATPSNNPPQFMTSPRPTMAIG